MKPIFLMRPPPVDTDAIHVTIAQALAAAGLDTRSGPMRQVTDTIRQALTSAGLDSGAPPAPPSPAGQVIDVEARVIRPDAAADAAAAPTAAAGRFESHGFHHRLGSRAYKLYIPARPQPTPALLVMLHGCTQSPDDFAAGTRMNALAEAHGFLVAYPEQPSSANPSRCWNWFNAADQQRDSGEPALIAGIVAEVAARHGVDGQRIFVAGLSAGAAMAVILGQTHPELFAAVGVHSGLPYGSAHDIPSALAAMKGGRGRAGKAAAARGRATQAVRTIVFHGDRDHTVQASNGAEVARQAQAALAARMGAAPAEPQAEQGSRTGRRYTRTVQADAAGQPCLEVWTVHGAGHAWSGGSAEGSFTDPAGPDASAEMVRFFLAP